ncbi:MAG: hypothetical protein ACREDR_22755 [Blastocatellia bacterium]
MVGEDEVLPPSTGSGQNSLSAIDGVAATWKPELTSFLITGA